MAENSSRNPFSNVTKRDAKLYQELAEQVSSLTHQQKFETALQKLLPYVRGDETSPVVRMEVATLLYEGHSSTTALNAREPFTEESLTDFRLDPFFCQCDECRSTWVPNPLYTFPAGLISGFSVANPLGGYCPNCGKTICRTCIASTSRGVDVSPCPDCGSNLVNITKPNGRSQIQLGRLDSSIQCVIVLRKGPIQPDPDYLTQLLHERLPQLFRQRDMPNIIAYPAPPDIWPKRASLLQLAFALLNKHGYEFTSDRVEVMSGQTKTGPGSQWAIIVLYSESKSKVATNTNVTSPRASRTSLTGNRLSSGNSVPSYQRYAGIPVFGGLGVLLAVLMSPFSTDIFNLLSSSYYDNSSLLFFLSFVGVIFFATGAMLWATESTMVWWVSVTTCWIFVILHTQNIIQDSITVALNYSLFHLVTTPPFSISIVQMILCFLVILLLYLQRVRSRYSINLSIRWLLFIPMLFVFLAAGYSIRVMSK